MPQIVFIQFTNPAVYPPLQHSSRILADRGWNVTFLSADSAGDANSLGIPGHARIIERRFGALPMLRGKVHFLCFCVWCVVHTIRLRAQAAYCSDPWSTPVGLFLHTIGIPVVYHEHDLPAPATSLAQRLTGWTRMQLARRTQAVVPSAGRARLLCDQTGAQQVTVVWNCPSREEANLAPAMGRPDQLRLIYHGSIVPARLPVELIDAMASPHLKSRTRLAVVGYETAGSTGYVARLQVRAKQLGIEDSIQYIGAVRDRQAMLAIAREADLGISLLPMQDGDANHSTMVGASNKPFDYLSQGVPVLVNCEQPWRECFVNSGYGRCCDPANSASIASQLRWFLENPDERTAMGAGGQSRIRSDWNYESQFAPVLSLLESITSLSHNSASQEPGRRDHRSFTAA